MGQGATSAPRLVPLAPSPLMKPAAVASALEEALGQLGVRVRRERGAFRGGLCVVGRDVVCVLNRQHPPEAQAAVLAGALRERGGAETLYLRPAVRDALEDLWARSDAGQADDVPDDDG